MAHVRRDYQAFAGCPFLRAYPRPSQQSRGSSNTLQSAQACAKAQDNKEKLMDSTLVRLVVTSMQPRILLLIEQDVLNSLANMCRSVVSNYLQRMSKSIEAMPTKNDIAEGLIGGWLSMYVPQCSVLFHKLFPRARENLSSSSLIVDVIISFFILKLMHVTRGNLHTLLQSKSFSSAVMITTQDVDFFRDYLTTTTRP